MSTIAPSLPTSTLKAPPPQAFSTSLPKALATLQVLPAKAGAVQYLKVQVAGVCAGWAGAGGA